MPINCDAIHLLIGLWAGVHPKVRMPITVAFICYQTIEELSAHAPVI